jgi:hypothetical protein
MPNYMSEELRRLVAIHAEHLCEYCLIHEEDTFFGCKVDHMISVKRGGPTETDNLAFACVFCNRQKGSDIGSILWRISEFSRFFNPRIDRWEEHFRLGRVSIPPQTSIGEVTAHILEFNHGDRLLERQTLIAMGKYPTASALTRMGE